MKAQVFETREYPKVGDQFRVFVVPKLWFNDRVWVDGSAPERLMVVAARQALDTSIPPGVLIIPQ